MDDAVPALFSSPVYTWISSRSRLTNTAVCNQMKRQYYDILFLGIGNTVKMAVPADHLETMDGLCRSDVIITCPSEFVDVEEVNPTANNTKPLTIRTS